ncbi:MAG: hypothetical protein ACLVI9_10725 [Anaerostipes hadrus]
MKNLLVAQSGGPSAAINATITGVIDAGIEWTCGSCLWCSEWN